MNSFFGILVAVAAITAVPSPRITYVKQQLVKEQIPASYVGMLFSDKRLAAYPAHTVTKLISDIRRLGANILAMSSLEHGQRFLEDNRIALKNAEETYGVPKEEIAAIIRVESNFGKFLGNTSVFNVFYTGVLRSSNKDWEWDAANLVALSKYCYRTKTDCMSVKGSYAGAFGLSQFLPYSVIEWGVDGDNNGIIDPFDTEDSIASTANFLKEHGWSIDKNKALAKYSGAGTSYTKTILKYAETLKKKSVLKK
jgi:membrane-bound lytic murein transglycosylase B